LIQDGLQSLRRGRTTFVMPIDLNDSQRGSDLVLEGGEIVERGTIGAARCGGRYKQLYDKQYRFERNQFIKSGEDFTS